MNQKIFYRIEKNIVTEVKGTIKEDCIDSSGYDSLGNEIYIQNKDLGKAKELMRVALSDEEEKGSKFILIVIVLLIISVFIAFAVFIYSSGGSTEKVGDINSAVKLNTVTKEEKVVGSIELRENTIDKNINSENETVNELEKNYRSEYEFQKLEASVKSRENTMLKMDIKELQNKNKSLKSTILELEKEKKLLEDSMPKKTDRDVFYLFLGKKVSKLCKETSSDKDINKCYELYYNFLENRQGQIYLGR